MKLVKQYLEKRIEQLNSLLNDEEEMYYASGAKSKAVITVLKEELQQVLTLFNEEYEKQEKYIQTINNNLNSINDTFDRINEKLNSTN